MPADNAAHVQEIVEAAREFVATTSYYRQRKESRVEFERLAYALLALRALGGRERDAATTSEPVFRQGDKIMVACPDCGRFGTHAGTCDWSLARNGRIWQFFAEAVEIKVAP